MADHGANTEVESRLELDHPLTFTTLTGDPIHARLKRLALATGDNLATCTIGFEVEWSTYALILAGDWFGMFSATREGTTAGLLDEGQPVELQASLRQSLLKAVLHNQADVEDILKTLLQEQADGVLPLRMSECWLIEEVKQLVELPDELTGGVLKQGYRTLWADQGVIKSEEADQSVATLNEIVESYLTRLEWSYERIDDAILRLTFRGDHGQWVVLVRTDEEKQLCIVYSIYPQLVTEPYQTAMAVFLNQENYDLAVGNFEMDMSDGELRYRTGIDVEHGRLTSELFGQLLTTNIAIMDEYFERIAEEMN
ncbi:YbjN domain-containing protein [Paenibacillus sp. WQ 127069]|uniref:YbjN domain-containing protein n=1 Tax=Paenibacillus baimaensis TaxID=2982185 RepID=A0ABT2UH90_9BACL|nr:YbjN domain-containing protein [Paenibacillus sp. WQ 127069]MCU6794013.1 YbjN domain-containing protein [Paenibacillus sp. WQ 127069]